MAWLATFDAHAARWPTPLRWLYVVLKWSLALLGGYAWIALWWQRHPLLGLSQVVIVMWVLLRERRPKLRRD